MKLRISLQKITFTNSWKAFAILTTGLLLTVAGAIHTKRTSEARSKADFTLICNEIITKIDKRLHTQAQLLRSGSGLFAVYGKVTRNDWQTFVEKSELQLNMKGIQGIGFSIILQKNQLPNHIRNIRNEGFTTYSVWPSGERDKYTSTIYLEPFSGKNLKALGYDMYSEPVRKRAMDQACDNNVAALSGKVMLVQETGTDKQAGTLMYVPVYRKGSPATSVAERRTAIIGWVYSPYRMDALMQNIIGDRGLGGNIKLHLQIYDNDVISDKSELFDSQMNDLVLPDRITNHQISIPFSFNGKKWTCCFTQIGEEGSWFQNKALLVLLGGIVISFLFFSLFLSVVTTEIRAKDIAEKLTYQIKESEIKLLALNETLEERIDERTKQFETTNRELSFRLREIEQFIYISSHDLSEPLNTLTNFTRLLKEEYSGKLDETGNKSIDFIHQAATRMRRLLKDLLIYSLLGKDSVKSVVDSNKVAGEVLADLSTLIDSSHCKVTVQELPLLTGYETELKLLFRNLISNAIKFQHEGTSPEIKISAELLENKWKFTVEDNGIGIKEQDKEKVFVIFKRMVNRNEFEGMGMGLALCKKIVEMHGGKIWVESNINCGSTFMFTIPI